MKFAIVFLIIAEITSLSWLKRFQELLCKEHVLEPNFFKNPNEKDKLLYIKQRNFCVFLLRKKKGFYKNKWERCHW